MATSSKHKVRIDDLELYIQESLAEAVDEAAEDAINYLCRYIEKNWYGTYDPKHYERTYDFLASATKTDTTLTGKGEAVCLLFFDTNKLIPEYHSSLNAHMGFDQKPSSDFLPAMIERGGFFEGRGYEKGLGAMEATIKMLEKDFPDMVAKKLRKQGLKIKVVGK